VDLLLRMGDVQVAFGILICCFMQRPSYLLQCTPSSSTFIKSFISFYSSLHKVFGCFLGPGSFDSHERFLIHKQTPLPITFSGIELISTFTIARTSYLRNWALVASVIVVRFMVDQWPFFLEALARVNNNTSR
jgi:hypothetical protein